MVRPEYPRPREDGVPKTPRLREWRARAALSQEELRDLSGVSRATIVDLEAGNRGAQPRTIRRLAESLGVEPEDLYGAPESPLAEAQPSAEQLPLNGFGEVRRVPSLQSWTALVNHLANRWEREIESREVEMQAGDPAVSEVNLLLNLNWANEIRAIAGEIVGVASGVLEVSLGVDTSEDALALFRALKRFDAVVDSADPWFASVGKTEPEGATVHDISEGAKRRAERKAALERTGRQFGLPLPDRRYGGGGPHQGP
jgi:transcriptional regulator with XRE-family HTH domain